MYILFQILYYNYYIGFFYSNAEDREKFVDSERKFTDDKVRSVIEFKRRVCKEGETFAVLNQKGLLYK